MPNPYPIARRERAVHAYGDGTNRYRDVGATYGVSLATSVRWVQRARHTGLIAPVARGGGWSSPIELPLLHRLAQGGRTERPTK
jgi:transposase